MLRRLFAHGAIFALVLLIIPSSASAAIIGFPTSIIPAECNCPGGYAGWGCVLDVVKNLLQFAIGLAVMITVLLFAWAGFLWVTNPANPANKEKGRSIMINAVIGLLITMGAWLIVNTVLTVISKYTVESATSVLGAASNRCIKGTPSSSTGGTTTLSTTPTANCPSCVSLASKGISCKSASSCTVVPSLANKLANLKNAMDGWRVTEAFPPTATHTNQCHYSGTCVDVGFTVVTYNGATIADFATKAQNAGVRPVFETFDCALRDAARAKGTEAYCASDSGYAHITGSHFSLYGP